MATAPTSALRVGFVGLGIMGRPMARNALKAGFPATVTNRTLDKAEPLRSEGAVVVRTPREVAQRSDIVVTMVTNAPDVEAVTFGPEGLAEGAHDGLLVVDMSSISPVAARSFAERAEAKGFRTLDAPVSGGEIGAIEAHIVEAREQAAQITECALGERQDPGGLGRCRGRADDRALLVLERVIERVAEIGRSAAECPGLAPQVVIVEGRETGERLVEGQDRLLASIPESRSMTLMIARFPSRPPPSCCSALYRACASEVAGSER